MRCRQLEKTLAPSGPAQPSNGEIGRGSFVIRRVLQNVGWLARISFDASQPEFLFSEPSCVQRPQGPHSYMPRYALHSIKERRGRRACPISPVHHSLGRAVAKFRGPCKLRQARLVVIARRGQHAGAVVSMTAWGHLVECKGVTFSHMCLGDAYAPCCCKPSWIKDIANLPCWPGQEYTRYVSAKQSTVLARKRVH